jgi:hypothetical protein
VRYLSVCSGIEAASVAWHHLGWTPVGFSEIEPFPAAVLKHRFPNVPNYGDMTKFEEWPIEPGTVDLLVGGTPCQSFSVAGLRKGLEDPRGNLMLTYLAIAARFKPRWVVWENVPGVLSSNGGRDLAPSSGRWANSGMCGPIECWTLNTCEWGDGPEPFRSAGDVCSLSDVLETGPLPQRFLLSAKACSGILRRSGRSAESRFLRC